MEYIVSYRRTGDSSNQLIKKKVSFDATSYTITNLRADSSYIVVLTAFAEGGQRLSSEVITCKTFGNAPGSPNRLAFQVTSATSLHVSWGEPAVTNGKITGYEIKYEPAEESAKSKGLPPTVVKIPNGSYRSLLVEGLIENTQYLYSVRAENEAGYGPWQQAKMKIDHQIGTRPPSTIFLDEQSIQTYNEQQRLLEMEKRSSSTSGKTTTTKEITTISKVRKQPPAKTVTSTDVTTRITRYLRAKGGKPAEKEVKEYPGRLTREEIEKLTSGCEKVEVNVMTRSLKKTVPGDSAEAKSSGSMMVKQGSSSSSGGGTVKTDVKRSKAGDRDVTTITRTIKTTSTANQERLQQQSLQQTSSTATSSKVQTRSQQQSKQAKR